MPGMSRKATIVPNVSAWAEIAVCDLGELRQVIVEVRRRASEWLPSAITELCGGGEPKEMRMLLRLLEVGSDVGSEMARAMGGSDQTGIDETGIDESGAHRGAAHATDSNPFANHAANPFARAPLADANASRAGGGWEVAGLEATQRQLMRNALEGAVQLIYSEEMRAAEGTVRFVGGSAQDDDVGSLHRGNGASDSEAEFQVALLRRLRLRLQPSLVRLVTAVSPLCGGASAALEALAEALREQLLPSLRAICEQLPREGRCAVLALQICMELRRTEALLATTAETLGAVGDGGGDGSCGGGGGVSGVGGLGGGIGADGDDSGAAGVALCAAPTRSLCERDWFSPFVYAWLTSASSSLTSWLRAALEREEPAP